MSTALWIWWREKCLFIKLNWVFERIFLLRITGLILINSIFSRIFEKVDNCNRLMGLKEEVMSGGFSGL